jgi:hypothetical protein
MNYVKLYEVSDFAQLMFSRGLRPEEHTPCEVGDFAQQSVKIGVYKGFRFCM